ncbi:MAG TPA: glycosylase [Candidatus Angelobacter sp.]|nr:glycosylase [Candidatus Angelobacter sp.]
MFIKSARTVFALVTLLLVFASAHSTFAAELDRQIVPAKPEGRLVDQEVMQKIYDEVKTPFKYGVVLQRDGTNEMIDCPSVFRFGERWCMMYVAITNKVGYQTFLANSDDLLHWTKLGTILPFSQTNWDAWQADAGIALADYHWNGSHELEQYDGKYWLSYIGGSKQGYETDPLSIGIAWTRDPGSPRPWNRLPENPVLSPKQPDARNFETKTLYKSQIIHDEAASLGWPFVMYYNAKYKNGFEQIGMAVSRDMANWQRYGTNSVVVNGEAKKNGISGDPQIVKIGDVWVMFYFGAGWQPHAFDTFACSYDLVHWTKWTGPNLIQPSEPFDKTYAHKPWVLKYKGVVYHFYCAVGTEGRVIALATSVDLKNPATRDNSADTGK